MDKKYKRHLKVLKALHWHRRPQTTNERRANGGIDAEMQELRDLYGTAVNGIATRGARGGNLPDAWDDFPNSLACNSFFVRKWLELNHYR
jgi:hypothetical protein